MEEQRLIAEIIEYLKKANLRDLKIVYRFVRGLIG